VAQVTQIKDFLPQYWQGMFDKATQTIHYRFEDEMAENSRMKSDLTQPCWQAGDFAANNY